jgi:23S rRNA (adenine2503-C2)-methyltransferase
MRNLTVGEILAQHLGPSVEMGDIPFEHKSRAIKNIVFMGQGEPLLNWQNVSRAVETLTNDYCGVGLSKTRITISTSGIVPLIERVGSELGVRLAISLHAPTNDLRSELMPINITYPLESLMEACRAYMAATDNERIPFE